MNALLRIGLFDDRDDGIVLMENLVSVVLHHLNLETSDVEIRSATRHLDAERIATTGECDLLLVDLMWPGATPGQEFRAGLNMVEMAKAANPRSVVAVITSKADQEQRFRDESRRRGADVALEWDEAFGSGKVATARDLAGRLAPAASWAVPRVERIERKTVGLVGLDTVAFSEQDDKVQTGIVESFLRYVNEAWSEVERPSRVRPIFLFTGDGLFLGIEGDAGPRLALDVAIASWRGLTTLARYEVRVTVHSGPAEIVTLSTGGHQLVGHSVNWLFRAVGKTPDGGLTVTEEYYKTVLQDGREQVPGWSFTRREEVAKHGRPIVLFDATPS